MIKTYYARSYTIYGLKGIVKIKGGESKVVNVVFNQATSQRGTAFYTTDKQEEQQLIEQSTDFHSGAIFIARQEEEKKATETQADKVSQQEIDTKEATLYKNREDLYNQLSALLPNEQMNKRATEVQLLEIAKRNNLLFVRN